MLHYFRGKKMRIRKKIFDPVILTIPDDAALFSALDPSSLVIHLSWEMFWTVSINSD